MPSTISLESVDEFFLPAPPGNRFERAFKDTEFVDKFFKFFESVIHFGMEICHLRHDETTVKSFEKAHSFIKIGRDCLALVATLAGGWRMIIGDIIVIARILKGIVSDTEVELKPAKKVDISQSSVASVEIQDAKERRGEKPVTRDQDPNTLPYKIKYTYRHKYNETAKTPEEKLVALGTYVTKLGNDVTFAVAFGVCRIAANLEKYFGVKSPAAHEIGSWFGDIMFANHAIGIAHNSCKIMQEILMSNRAIHEGGANAEKICEERDHNLFKAFVALVLKILEVLICTLKKLQAKELIKAIHPMAYATMGLVAGFLGLYSVWQRTP